MTLTFAHARISSRLVQRFALFVFREGGRGVSLSFGMEEGGSLCLGRKEGGAKKPLPS